MIFLIINEKAAAQKILISLTRPWKDNFRISNIFATNKFSFTRSFQVLSIETC